MSTATRFLGVIVVVGAVAACTAPVDRARQMTPQDGEFNKALYNEYLALSQSERDQYDFRDSRYYAEKAMAAAQGKSVGPQEVSERSLPEDSVSEISQARQRLVAALGAGAPANMPAVAARAQANFDCWMEQKEENHQPRDIARCRDTFMEAMAELEAPVAVMGVPEVIQISSDVLFDFDKAQIKPDFMPVLDEIAELLVENTNIPVLVWGHTDSIGTEEYNQGLSERRANAVADYFETKGVSESRMTVQGFGESKPIASNDTPEGRAENRRVEIRSR